MAHEIMEYDNMISVKERPWHGLGIILEDAPTPKEAQIIAGLDWTVRKEAVSYRMPAINGMSRMMQVPGAFAIVRNDNNFPLGVVGANYEPYQNDAMFDFMEVFCKEAKSKIETAGSLRNGKIVWALSTAGETEYLKNDPIEQYFLFKNGFDGSTNIEICFTNVRVVCNNTLTAALSGASNIWRIRHTASLHAQVQEVQTALLHQHKNAEALQQAMIRMAAVPMTEQEIRKAAATVVAKGLEIEEGMEQQAFDSLTSHQTKIVDKILELHETGRGSDIPGVRGSVYGFLNACTEYADHYKTIRPGSRSFAEARFESLMMGSAQDFKTKAFDYAYALAS